MIMRPLRVLLLACLGLIAATCHGAQLRGVDPQLRKHYVAGTDGLFACLDGLKRIPFNTVNDDYCDCFDGSDEPGTSACPNGVFYCRNQGHEPLRLNASFVDDGICDCCDGSDEQHGCANTCKQLGAESLKTLVADVAAAEAGMKAKQKYIAEAAGLKQGWQQRLDEVEAELTGQQAVVDELKGKRDAAQEVERKLQDLKKAAEEEERKQKEAEEAARKEKEGAQPEGGDQGATGSEQGDAAGAVTEDAPAQYGLEVVNDEDIRGPQAAGAEGRVGELARPMTGLEKVRALKKELSDKIDTEAAASLAAREAAATAASAGEPELVPEAAGGEGEGEKEESAEELAERIRAQWIPGSKKEEEGHADLADDDGEDLYHLSPEGADVEDLDHADMDDEDQIPPEDYTHEEDEDLDGAPPPAQPPAAPHSPPKQELRVPPWAKKVNEWGLKLYSKVTGKPLSTPAASPPPLSAVDAELAEAKSKLNEARSAFQEEERKLNSLQAERTTLQGNLQREYGPEGEFAVLVNKCFDAKIDKYTYQVCPFDKSAQKEGHSSTSLGTWQGFGGGYSSMKFSGGQTCWQGPARSMEVSLHCGSAEELTHVEEPSRCEYHAQLATPAACSAQRLQELKDSLAAKQRLLEAPTPEEHDEL